MRCTSELRTTVQAKSKRSPSRPGSRAIRRGCSLRLAREDGAYDSGLRKLTRRIEEDLPLREGAFNIFALRILDAHGNSV